jgi:hypothetical protein
MQAIRMAMAASTPKMEKVLGLQVDLQKTE